MPDEDAALDGGLGDGGLEDGGLEDGGLEDGGPGDGPNADAPSSDGASRDGASDGGAADAITVDGVSPPPARVRLSELILTPVHDWSDASGVNYDPTPGGGAVNGRDELIELVNEDTVAVDLTGWRLEIIDSEASTQVLSASTTSIYFSPGSSLTALAPGGFVVIGDPPDSFSTDAFVRLFAPTGELVDDVEVGGNSPARDMEGDGVGDGAPDPTQNGFARGAFEEAIARPAGRADTDVDQADWVAMRATPGAANVPPVFPPELIRPIVLVTPSGSSHQVTAPLQIELSEPILHTSVDASGVVTATSAGVAIPLGFHTFEEDDRVLVLNPIGRLPFDADVTVVVRGGAAGLTDLHGNPLLTDLTFTIHTEPAPLEPGRVLLNELCISPLVDWSDTEGGNLIAYDGVPGTGLVTSVDEWIELRVGGVVPLDLRTWTIVEYTGPSVIQPARAVTRLGDGPTRVVGTGTGIADVQPGDYVVLGNPSGALLASAWIELRDGSGAIVDAVEVGGNQSASDRGGDGIANGAPGPDLDGSSTTLFDEVVARLPDGVDTGDDVLDWSHAAATPGAPNGP